MIFSMFMCRNDRSVHLLFVHDVFCQISCLVVVHNNRGAPESAWQMVLSGDECVGDLSFNDTFRLTLWLRGFYLRHNGMPSILDAHMAQSSETRVNGDGEVGSASRASADRATNRRCRIPPNQIVLLMTSHTLCPTIRSTYRCCIAQTCQSLSSRPQHSFHPIAAPSSTHRQLSCLAHLPAACATVHRSIHWTDDANVYMRLIPDPSSAVGIINDTIACASCYTSVVADSPVSLVIQHYQAHIGMSQSDGDRHDAIRALFVGDYAVRQWRSVTIYRVSASAAEFVSSVLSEALVKEGRKGPTRGGGLWTRLRLGSFRLAQEMFCALASTDFLTEVALEDCLPTSSDAAAAIGALTGKRHLTRLSLRMNPTTAACAAELASLLVGASGTSAIPSLTALDLALCGWDAEVLGSVISRLSLLTAAGGVCALRHFDISHNRVSLLGASSLLTELSDRKCVGGLSFFHQLESLDLSGNPLVQGVRGDAAHPSLVLLGMLPFFPRLARLRVNDTNLCQSFTSPAKKPGGRGKPSGDHGRTSSALKRVAKLWAQNVLAAYRADRPSWIGTTPARSEDNSAPVIRNDFELAFGGCGLSVADVKGVLNSVQLLSGLSCETSVGGGMVAQERCFRLALTLYANEVEAVVAGLGDRNTNMSLRFLVSLDLRTCCLGNEGAALLSASLERCAASGGAPLLLESLNLSDNQLGSFPNGSSSADGIVLLCRSLRHLVAPHLRVCDLSFNGIRNFKPISLMILQSSCTLETLVLSGNDALSGSNSDEAVRRSSIEHILSTLSDGTSGHASLSSGSTAVGRPPYVDIIDAIRTKLDRRADSVKDGLSSRPFCLCLQNCGLAAGVQKQLMDDSPITVRLFL